MVSLWRLVEKNKVVLFGGNFSFAGDEKAASSNEQTLINVAASQPLSGLTSIMNKRQNKPRQRENESFEKQ